MSEAVFNRPSTYFVGKTTKTTKEYEKNETRERRRNMLYLIFTYLKEQNLQESALALANEAQLTTQFEICDNVDLDIMYQDYETYYHTRFGKNPKIVKKCAPEPVKVATPTSAKRRQKSVHTVTSGGENSTTNIDKRKESPIPSDISINVISLTQKNGDVSSQVPSFPTSPQCASPSQRPLCEFEGYNAEWREFADLVIKEFVPKNLGVSWTDCIGVDETINLLKEAVVYPATYPELYTGLLSPWKGVLLYGPPGTGKTLLAKALACETSSTFINVCSSSFVSKWRGESEKMIKVLFDVARFYAPTVIFIDEVDSLACKLDDMQHDASRRFRSELLTQLDGLLSGTEKEKVFVLAATNSPWNLEAAMLRRFEKRIFLSLPSQESRSVLFRYFFKQHRHNLQNQHYEKLAEETEYYTGSDIKLVCKEAAMNLARETMKLMNEKRGSSAAVAMRPLKYEDVACALKNVKPLTQQLTVKKYEKWTEQYGLFGSV